MYVKVAPPTEHVPDCFKAYRIVLQYERPGYVALRRIIIQQCHSQLLLFPVYWSSNMVASSKANHEISFACKRIANDKFKGAV